MNWQPNTYCKNRAWPFLSVSDRAASFSICFPVCRLLMLHLNLQWKQGSRPALVQSLKWVEAVHACPRINNSPCLLNRHVLHCGVNIFNRMCFLEIKHKVKQCQYAFWGEIMMYDCLWIPRMLQYFYRTAILIKNNFYAKQTVHNCMPTLELLRKRNILTSSSS